MTKIPKDQIDACSFSRENAYGINVQDQFYGKKGGFLDDEDSAVVTKDIVFEGRQYHSNQVLRWNDPLYSAARQDYLTRFGPDAMATAPWLYSETPPVQSKPVDYNARDISQRFRLISADGISGLHEVPEGYQFKTGDVICFNVGAVPNATFIVRAPTTEESAAFNIQMADPSGLGLAPIRSGGAGRVLYSFVEPGHYEVEYSISSGIGKIQQGTITFDVVQE